MPRCGDDVHAEWAAKLPIWKSLMHLCRSDGVAGRDAIKRVALEDFTPTRVAPVTVHGEFATTFVELSKSGVIGPTTLSAFQIKNGKVARQWNFEPGVTAPFDSALK